MLYLGIILGLVTALLMAIDTYMNKELMNNTSPLLHSGYRILFVIPYLLIAALFNWNFNIKCIYMLLIYGVNEVINIIFHQKAINKLNIVHDEMLSKSNLLFIYLISLLLYEGSFNTYGLLSIILFTLGMIFTIDFKSLKIIKEGISDTYNNRNDNTKSSFLGVLFELLSVLARSIKPFLLKRILLGGLISNEVLNLFSMLIAFVIIMIIFRPQMNFKNINIKMYLLQALFVGASMITSGYAIIYAGEVLSSMLDSLSIFLIIILMLLLKKKKTDLLTIIGSIIVTTSIFMQILF